MESKAKLFGHAVHPMLIVFPLGLLATSLLFDLIYLGTNDGRWADTSYLMIAVGIISGVIAAVFGLIDWLAIPDGTRAKAVGLWHGGGNAVMLVLFLISWFIRRPDPAAPGGWAIALSAIGVGLAVVTGWLGGELVERLAVGVSDGGHLNSPSSLSDRPASDTAGPESAIRPVTITSRAGMAPTYTRPAAGRTAGMEGDRGTYPAEEERRPPTPAPDEAKRRESPPM